YQFFLNFGNAVAANDTVSTASIVYKQGVAGVWMGLQMIFLNPYYWFFYPWLRRVRLTTMADLFWDRLGSRRLALFYASFQIIMAVTVTMAFGNLVSYKISAALITKPETEWTARECQSVDDYKQLIKYEATIRDGGMLDSGGRAHLAVLREKLARNELTDHVTALNPWVFYIIYTLAVGFYIVLGGMRATAMTDAFQGILIIIFSILLIPTGLAAMGGWDRIGERVPSAMLNVFGASGDTDFTVWTILAILAATFMQAHALPNNMAVAGSARNEYTARFGAVTGTFGKRILTIVWAICGLLGIVLFSGSDALADPDMVWGAMSRRLLGPGLLGLMFAGILAANMSTVASQGMAVSALFARNIYGTLRKDMTDAGMVRAGRWTLVVILMLGVLVATQLESIYVVLQFAMTINVPFGAAILMMFIWRKVTAKAVWVAVLGGAFINIIFPVFAHQLPSLARNSMLVTRTEDAAGRPVPVYFESVVRVNPDDSESQLEGRGRLHTELLVLRAFGMNPAHFTAGGRFAARFFVDAFLPVFLVVIVSLFTRRPGKERVDAFFGKMKTPVAGTPELDAEEMEKTRQNPSRMDHTKLFRGTSWEFTRWNRVDTIGFVLCCAMTAAILAVFIGVMKWLTP
ncbi:MAG: hypothetical protein LBC18_15820, partial [Opitutaceae bacterium]|nr:hypothetical protein [Opitutaceae bacterium]